MLVQEIALIAGILSSLIALTSCLLVLVSRRQMNRKMDDLRFELQVHMSANHEMAKHLRVLQKASKAASKADGEPPVDDLTRDSDELDFMQRFGSSERSNGARHSLNPQSRSGMSLAEKLGLSESEADIMSHLRPTNQRQAKRRVQETI